jgi:hypothetical protein
MLPAHCPYCNAKKLFSDTQAIRAVTREEGEG